MSQSPLLGTSQLHRQVRYDARREILESIGDVSDLQLFGNQLIVAPYVHTGIQWSAKYGFPLEERLSLEALYELYDASNIDPNDPEAKNRFRGIVTLRNPNAAKESIFQGAVYLVVAIGEESDEAAFQRRSAEADNAADALATATNLGDPAAVDAAYRRLARAEAAIHDANSRRLNVGDWVFTLQENTRSLSITSATARKSRVLSEIGVDYAAGWPTKLCYSIDIYGRLPHQDMVV